MRQTHYIFCLKSRFPSHPGNAASCVSLDRTILFLLFVLQNHVQRSVVSQWGQTLKYSKARHSFPGIPKSSLDAFNVIRAALSCCADFTFLFTDAVAWPGYYTMSASAVSEEGGVLTSTSQSCHGRNTSIPWALPFAGHGMLRISTCCSYRPS